MRSGRHMCITEDGSMPDFQHMQCPQKILNTASEKKGENMKKDMDKRDFPEEDRELLNLLKEEMEKEGSAEQAVNEKRIALMQETIRSLRQIVHGAVISARFHKPFKSAGSISLRGRRIEIIDTAAFAELIRQADCLETYARNNGVIQINFSYDNLTYVIR